MSIGVSTRPVMARKGKVLVILSWGSVAWYRPSAPMVTVGELRQQLAKELGRLFDGEVVGLELFITGTGISPAPSVSLCHLTHAPYRNVCLDVAAGPRSQAALSADSVGERLLRKHMSEELFQAGLAQQLWRLIELNWPHGIFAIRSAVGGQGGEVVLRLNFERYPLAPPLVELWDAERRTPIRASDWPEFFTRFLSQNYPQFADVATEIYCPNLLLISTEVARRLKDSTSEQWEVGGDLTQILARASCSFRIPPAPQNNQTSTSEFAGREGKAFRSRRRLYNPRVDKISTGPRANLRQLRS